MSKSRFPLSNSNQPKPPQPVAPGLDADEDSPPQRTTATPDTNPPTESKDTSDVEYGTVSFQPLCGRCTNNGPTEVRMVAYKSVGPIAYYRCKACGDSVQLSRPWRPRMPGFNSPNVAAREDMM